MSMPSELNSRSTLAVWIGGALLASAPLAAWFVQDDSFVASGRESYSALVSPRNSTAAAVTKVSTIKPTITTGKQDDEVAKALGARPGESHMQAAIRWSHESLARVKQIPGYSARLITRERVDGALQEEGQLNIKVRHEPFSLYLAFEAPRKAKGQECIYVAGKNDGKMLAHACGLKHQLLGTLALKPASSMAMNGNRHPVTDVGIRRMLEKFIEIGEREAGISECSVTLAAPRIINGRECECMEFTHPDRREQLLYYKVRVFIDPQWDLPVRFESYDWPISPAAEAPVLEEYTYENVVLNTDFSDNDFDVQNPAYQFSRRRSSK